MRLLAYGPMQGARGYNRPKQSQLTMPPLMPNLLYLGDVPVESSFHGSALLFRLLQTYPAERLMILEATPWRSRPDRRLPGVSYDSFPIGWARLLNSRFSREYGSVVLGRMPGKWRQ